MKTFEQLNQMTKRDLVGYAHKLETENKHYRDKLRIEAALAYSAGVGSENPLGAGDVPCCFNFADAFIAELKRRDEKEEG